MDFRKTEEGIRELTQNHGIGVFGEVLFDVFPDKERVLGGAPFNVAWHLQALRCSPRLLSRVGKDADGDAIVDAMREWGMDTAEIQIDARRPTGRVVVHLDRGQPSYDILSDQAYDAISAAEITQSQYALLYHGTLALRTREPRRALEKLKLSRDCTVFMDVNLRDPWWDRDYVLQLADQAQWIKLNDSELSRLAPMHDDLESAARAFLSEHELHGVVVTRGENGAFAVTRDGQFAETTPHPSTIVKDTVGAGDAFAAIIIVGIVRDWPLDEMLQRAQRFASQVVQQRGAVVADRTIYNAMLDDWSLVF
jgi:fructokinase